MSVRPDPTCRGEVQADSHEEALDAYVSGREALARSEELAHAALDRAAERIGGRPVDRLRHHVTGAIERGEAEAIEEVRADMLRSVASAGGRARSEWMQKDASPSMPLDAIYGRVTITRRAMAALPGGTQYASDAGILALAAFGDVERILRAAGYTF